MAIKSLDELKEIREQHQNKTALRYSGDLINNHTDHIEILVGMATCGIASGARETLNELTKIISEDKIENIRVIPVGCMGYCKEEPIIQINMPNSEPVIYGHVKKNKVKEIVESHIKEKKPVEKMIIHVDFDRA